MYLERPNASQGLEFPNGVKDSILRGKKLLIEGFIIRNRFFQDNFLALIEH